MGWQRKQYDKYGTQRVRSGEKDWSRSEKEAIRQYEERYGNEPKREGNHEGSDYRQAG